MAAFLDLSLILGARLGYITSMTLVADKSLSPALVDPFGRAVTYLRVSVTDRCDFRCNLLHVGGHDLPAEAGSAERSKSSTGCARPSSRAERGGCASRAASRWCGAAS
jgi:hypothetical protein